MLRQRTGGWSDRQCPVEGNALGADTEGVRSQGRRYRSGLLRGRPRRGEDPRWRISAALRPQPFAAGRHKGQRAAWLPDERAAARQEAWRAPAADRPRLVRNRLGEVDGPD